MRTVDGGEGCVLGAMPVAHEGGETSSATLDAEFVIPRDCYELVGRDVELFASFDPWNRIGDREVDPLVEQLEQAQTPSDFSLYNVVAAAALSVEGCESCETSYALGSSPGLDAQLQELSTSSTVAVLPVSGEDGTQPQQDHPTIDFTVSSLARVTGLDSGEGLPEGQVRLRHTLRPLGSHDEGMPLIERKGDFVGHAYELSVPSYGDLTTVSALSIEGETRELIAEGSWSDIDEFELVTCLETEFEQAIYAGEAEPRANDCGAIPVVIVREPVGVDGQPLPHPGAAKARSAEVWGGSWGADSGYGFGYSGVDFEAWLDNNGSDTATTTHHGIDVASPGSWFEAGVYATGTVFDNTVDLINIYATFIAYDFGGGGVAMAAKILWKEYIPEFELQLKNGIPLSINEIFDAVNLDVPLEYTTPSLSLVGVSFNDGCGSVNAGIWIDATIGIDGDNTTITVRSTTQGVEVEGVIEPFATLTAHAGATVQYAEYLHGGIEAALDVVDVRVPFTAAVEFIDYDPLDAFRLQFTESAIANITALSGKIGFSIWYKVCFIFCWEDDHTHTIATWDGIDLGSYSLFSANQNLNLGTETTNGGGSWCSASDQELLSGDFDGDGAEDYLCWRTSDGHWSYDFGSDGFHGSELSRDSTWCGANDQILVGDFNGDGRDDLLCHGNGLKQIDIANTYGVHASVNKSLSFSWCDGGTYVLRIEDVNDDGLDDWHCYKYATGKNYVMYNSGAPDYFDGTSDWTYY